MSDKEDDRQQQGSNEKRQRQKQREESEMRSGEDESGPTHNRLDDVMSDSEDDRQQQGSNEQRQRQLLQREESEESEIPKRFGPNPPTGGAKKCDPQTLL